MAALSITSAWNETVEYVKRHGGALFTIALALVALPSVVLQALGPGQMAPGQTPEPGLWMLLIPVVMVLSIVGTLAISALALGRESVVGSAIGLGFRRFLPMLGATLLLVLAAIVVMIPIALIVGLTPTALSAPTPALVGKVALAVLLLFVILIFFWVRLMLMTPVAAAETGGSIAIIRRSWELTRGHFWKLLGFVLLLGLVLIVVGAVVGIVFGILLALIAGPPEPGSLSALLVQLVGALVNAAFAVVFTTMVARIYRQLAGETESLAEVFE